MGWLRLPLAMALSCLALILPGVRPARIQADQPSGVTLEATAGFGGLARVGHTLPITVDVSNTGPDRALDLSAEAQASAAGPRPMLLPAIPYRARYHLPVTLPHGAHKRLTLHLPLSALASGVVVQAWQGATLVAETTAPLTEVGPRQIFAAVVSDLAESLPALAAATMPGLSSSQHPAVAPLLTGDLPTEPDELDALDVLVLTHANTQGLTEQQRLALQGWVAEGGTLVLSGGASWPAVSGGLPKDLLPAAPGAGAAARDLAPLAAFADVSAAPVGPALVVTGAARGRTLAGAADAPLLTLLPYGAGSVILSAADLAAEPLRDWSGAPALWQRLLTLTLPAHVLTGPVAVQPFVGVVDVMSNALANVPQAAPRAWPWLAGLLVLYVVALPVVLLILRRVRRSTLGLFLLPVAALGVAALAYGAANRERGGPVVVNAVTITEVPPGSPVARVSAYYALFAPVDHAYHVQFPGGGLLTALDPPFVKRFVASTGGAPPQPPVGLDLRQDGAADLPPIDVWTSRGVARQRWLAGVNPVQARVVVAADGVSGVVTNGGAQPLEDCAVLSPWGAIQLGTLSPGRSAPFRVAATAGLSPAVQFPTYGGPPVGVTPAQFRERQFRQQVINAFMVSRGQGGDATAALGPLQFLAWTAPAEPAPEIDGQPVAESGEGLLLVGLPVAAPATDLPPGLLPAHLESVLGATAVQGGRLALNNATLAVDALLPAPPTPLRSVTLRVSVVGGNGGLPSIAAYNRRTGNYDPLQPVRRSAAPVGPVAPPTLGTPPAGRVPAPAPVPAMAPKPLVAFPGSGFAQVDATLGPGDLAAYIGPDGAVRFRIDAAGNVTLALPITYGYTTGAAPL